MVTDNQNEVLLEKISKFSHLVTVPKDLEILKQYNLELLWQKF